MRHPIVFRVDVDNTLVDNDGIQQDLKDHLEGTYGVAARDRYWMILEDLMEERGYRDHIGAQRRFRVEHPREVDLLAMSSFLMDYPFADRLYPDTLRVLQRLRSFGPTVILSDGDVVFQPRKVERAGLARVADGDVLMYIHKGRWTTSSAASQPNTPRRAVGQFRRGPVLLPLALADLTGIDSKRLAMRKAS